ncbi:Copia-like polyprotein/retrotransposon [Rhizoctonia solani]|uniref:Copia-like polyprotein/retrotransposon n=1 Tax=Rhizoctonia solani TaxID=456999 RepID=A0A8H8P850_9AGAM|nr:Copia-like polyprotein/retrotransposon [Rhizoctonia solani]QRW26325.1 Copia-like polyprotein/retrotransposon [Rhizoctonia solani]
MVRKGAVKGMDIIGSRSPPELICGPCIQGKQTRAPFSKSQNHALELLELMHSDLCGPLPIKAIGGFRYFSVTIDNKLRMMFVNILKSKDEYPLRFKELKASVENLIGNKIKILRTNGGGKYQSKEFESWMRTNGIQHQVTKPDSSESNGVAERAIRTINDCQQTIRIDMNMADRFWGYAVIYAAYLWNITPKRFLNGRTPQEIFTGKVPDVSQIRIFGCKAWARVPDNKQTKLQARSIKCQYLGFAPNQKAHILVERSSGKILTSQDVVFDKGGESRQQIIIEDFEKPKWNAEQVGDEKESKTHTREVEISVSKTDEKIQRDGPMVKIDSESKASTTSPHQSRAQSPETCKPTPEPPA